MHFFPLSAYCSCCFWLYDNVAAEKAGPDASNEDAWVPGTVIPQQLEEPAKPETLPPPLPPPDDEAGEPPTNALESEPGSGPRAGDTSVPVEEADVGAHRVNSNSDYVVSEYDLASSGSQAPLDEATDASSTAQVPNNQLDNHNRHSVDEVHSVSESQQALESPKEKAEKQAHQDPQPPEQKADER